MKSRFIVIIATLALPLASVSARAAGDMSNMSGMPGMSASSGTTEATTAQGHGKVDRVDPTKGTVTITHGPIPAIGWPAMTMEFPFKDRAMAKRIKVGQTVDFELAPIGGGTYEVVRITRVQP